MKPGLLVPVWEDRGQANSIHSNPVLAIDGMRFTCREI